MSTAAIVVIGNEILTGKVTDENSPWLARRLREVGCDLRRITVVLDDVSTIAEEVRRVAVAHDHVFTSGGVGPTHDDVTMRGVAAAFEAGLRRDADLERLLREKFGDRCTDATMRMADVPDGSTLWWDGQIFFPTVVKGNVCILPGVPELFRLKFDAVAHRFRGDPVQGRRLVTTESESAIAARLDGAAARWPQVEIGSYPQFRTTPYTVTVTFDSRDSAALEACYTELREALAPGITDL